MEQKNITFFKNQDKSSTIVDLYLNNSFSGYKDSYNCYDTDVDKILYYYLEKVIINILLDIMM